MSAATAAPPASRRAPPQRRASAQNPPLDSATAALVDANGQPVYSLEKKVKNLRSTKALTLPEGTLVADACRKMTTRRVDCALVTDSRGLLSGIVTAEDVSGKVVAEGLRPDQTKVSMIMSRNVSFVMADSLALDALQKMVHGKFRHLPVVENGEVISVLEITKFLYDAITKMEKAAEQGNAIAAVMEGVQQDLDFPGYRAFIESLLERLFKPSLSTIISQDSSVPIVSPSDPVLLAAQKMRDWHVNSVVVMTGSKLLGIMTSKDVLLKVVAQGVSPEVIPVEKVMTPHPDYATLDTSILDALHSMQDGKFLHIPVVDRDGQIIACMDVLQLIYAALSVAEGSPEVNDMANTMVKRFWDSAIALQHQEDEDEAHGDDLADENSANFLHIGDSFAFKIEDQHGRVHRFECASESVDDLKSAALQKIRRTGNANVELLYEDTDGDKVVLTTDEDLVTAIEQAKFAKLKTLRLHVAESATGTDEQLEQKSSSLQFAVAASAIAVICIGLFLYLRYSNELSALQAKK